MLLARNMSVSDRSIPGAFGIALWILRVVKIHEEMFQSLLTCLSFAVVEEQFHKVGLTFLLLDWDAVEKVGSPFLSHYSAHIA